MTVPGPPSVLWGVALLLFALATTGVGEAIRLVLAPRVEIFRSEDPFERFILDLYLGGAGFYVLAALPMGLFFPATLILLFLLAAAGIVYRVLRTSHRPDLRRRLLKDLRFLSRPSSLLVLVSFFGVFAFELAVAAPIPTGNTYDSSLYVTYVALLAQQHHLPLSFQPIAPFSLIYPQGSTVWFASTQWLFGLPPARTPLLVTPFFFALAPVAAGVLGRRLIGGGGAAASFAVVIAFLAPWTRTLVGGSNDFTLSFPLVLVLAGLADRFGRAPLLSATSALSFGGLAGYSAALNPVGAQWLFLLLPLLAASWLPRFAGDWRGWSLRWLAAVGAALVFVLPSLIGIAEGLRAFGFVAGTPAPPPSTPVGLSVARWVGSVDPFLFGPNDVWLSPVPLLRDELAILITAGAALFLLPLLSESVRRELAFVGRWIGASIVVLVGLLVLVVVAGGAGSPLEGWLFVSSGAELSILLFTVYVVLATVPLVLLAREIEHSELGGRTATRWNRERMSPPARAEFGRGAVCLVLGVLVVAPGLVATGAALPNVLDDLYESFGNVTSADFAMLSWMSGHLPSGARLLVAPGSAAEFLPGYDAAVQLVFPMVLGFPWLNASYSLVVRELTHGVWDPAGVRALTILNVGFVAVTQQNSAAFPPFLPEPLLTSSSYPLLFQMDDAYVFATG